MTYGIEHIDVGPQYSHAEFIANLSHDLRSGNAFPVGMVERDLFYRNDLNKWYIYNGAAWIDLTVGTLIDQDVSTTASPTWVGATFTGLTASRLLATDGAQALASVANLTAWIAGTANRVTVSDDGDGTITLSGPQNIHTAATPQFARLYLDDVNTYLDMDGANNMTFTDAVSGTLTLADLSGGGAGAAPKDATYVTITNNAVLTAEVLLSALGVYNVGGTNWAITGASGDATFNQLILTLNGAQSYLFSDRLNSMTIQGQDTATSVLLELYTKDGDTTDTIGFALYSLGLPADITNRERLLMYWQTALSEYHIEVEVAGTGTTRPLVLHTEGNADQLRLETDGTVSMSSILQVDTINEYTGATGVTIEGILLQTGLVDGVHLPEDIYSHATQPLNSHGNSFATVQLAVNDLAGDGWVYVPEGTWNEAVTTAHAKVLLFGAGKSSIIDGGIIGTAVTLSGADSSIQDIQLKTTTGGGNTYRGALINGTRAYLRNVYISQSDRDGIYVNATFAKIVECNILDCDNTGIYVGASDCTIIGDYIYDCFYHIELGNSADGSLVIGNRLDDCTNDSIVIYANADNCAVIGNRITNEGTEKIDNDSTTSIVFGNTEVDSMIPSAEKIQFRDAQIYIASLNDGYLDVAADLGIRLNQITTMAAGMQFNGAADGVVNFSKAGTISDADFTTDTTGLLGIDTTNERIYFRVGAADWEYVSGYRTVTKTMPLTSDAFGRPNVNPPSIIDQDNLTLYSFTLNTDRMTLKFPVPWDYVSGDITFEVYWTNDGGVDDDAKDAKWQLDYQVGIEGDDISGSHANSPKSINDTYVGAVGWVEHHTAVMTIAAADFAGKDCIFLKLSAITPDGAALTCEPHLIGMCYTYTAHNYQES